MKKAARRIVTLFTAMAILLSMSVLAFAETTIETTEAVWMEDNITVKITEEIRKDETIIRQYNNDVLLTAVHIPQDRAGSSTTLSVEMFNASGRIQSTESIIVEKMQQSNQKDTRAGTVNLGTIKYSTSDGEKSIIVRCETNNIGNSVVSLPAGTSTVASLASVIVTAVGMLLSKATQVVRWILNIMSIATTAGSFAFPGRSLSCKQINYIYYLTNGSNSSHTNRFISYYYYVTDDRAENASYKGTTKINGWTPSTAKTQITFSQKCYTYMFEGSYSVIGWV